MGYRSQVALKTTTEGYLLFKKFNDSIEKAEDQPLCGMTIQRTASGFYKISHDEIKWYDSFSDVANFMEMLNRFDHLGIPYKFIRIGEDYEDIDVRENWVDDMPDELETFDVERTIYDESEGSYEDVED